MRFMIIVSVYVAIEYLDLDTVVYIAVLMSQDFTMCNCCITVFCAKLFSFVFKTAPVSLYCSKKIAGRINTSLLV